MVHIRQLAEAIYTAVSGADNKAEHTELVTEIADWLTNGETLTGNETVEELANEWREYQAEAEV